jgi:hypothetical protein
VVNGLTLDELVLYLFDAKAYVLRLLLLNEFLFCEFLDVRKLFA